MNFQYHSAKGARLFVDSTAIANGGTGTTEMDLIGANMGATNEIARFVTSKTGRVPYREVTFADNSLSFAIEDNYLAHPTGSNGGNLTVLNTGTIAAVLYLNVLAPAMPGTADACFNFSSLVIQSAPVSLQIEGKEALNYTLPINGPWTEPK